MSDDIVERLREAARKARANYGITTRTEMLNADAAEEIEKLRAIVAADGPEKDRLRAVAIDRERLVGKAADEIERLRAVVNAYERLTRADTTCGERPSSDEMAEIRKAIQEAKDVGVLGISGRSWLMLVMAAEGYTILAGKAKDEPCRHDKLEISGSGWRCAKCFKWGVTASDVQTGPAHA